MGVGDAVRWTIRPSNELDDYIYKLQKMGNDTEEMIKRSAYPAAGLIYDACISEISAIPVIQKYGKHKMLEGLTADQKDGILDGFGIAKFRNESGFIHVKLGVDGYNSTVTKRWPRGQPNAMILRSVENGTSFMRAHHPIAKAVRSSRQAAIQKMKEQFDEETRKVMGI